MILSFSFVSLQFLFIHISLEFEFWNSFDPRLDFMTRKTLEELANMWTEPYQYVIELPSSSPATRKYSFDENVDTVQ